MTTIFFFSLFGVFLLVYSHPTSGLKATPSYVPQGSNPLLYKPGVDAVTHLDQITFADTVFDASKRNSYLVEFYADWCGHCRAFAPFFREFARLVKNWAQVTQVAAINCADNFNGEVCRASGATFFPLIKYFPRFSKNFSDGLSLEMTHSSQNLRDQLVGKVLNEYHRHGHPDWPDLSYVDVTLQTRFEDLWRGTQNSANFLLIVFEKMESGAAQAVLDLLPFRSLIGVRRALATSPLVEMLRITEFPYVALFRRGDQQSIYMDKLRPSTLQDVLNLAQPGQMITLSPTPEQSPMPAKRQLIDCQATPERCKELYFASETDMLKGMRMALLDDVMRANSIIAGQNFTHLYNFVSLLAEFFPTLSFTTTTNSEPFSLATGNPPPPPSNEFDGLNGLGSIKRERRSTMSSMLQRSSRARQVFIHLRAILDSKTNGSIPSAEWFTHFQNAERVFAHPFPIKQGWEHCKGSSSEFRGYTCALWTSFHSLTVHTYMGTLSDAAAPMDRDPLRPLKAIQGWVQSFFGCRHCSMHFMHMTTQLFPLNEQRVKRGPDTIMYLWRAHNIVNARLHGDVTEDPQFPKYQFPPPFLCPLCHSGGLFSRRQVRNFLLRYYANIRPTVIKKLRRSSRRAHLATATRRY